ncbi:hypothetical protein PCANC_18214 [Puccinia coronata f. sp. avenae]|uniref:Uncharacterized protein n=1 Tax=Puccinia coronata f. sp. avenae TaxID=200324 RepID=A0A2N5SLI9_9BASI|nr:hypothetical protein PCANC_18214 [Puccinia coronata f. sp. avenae]
MFSLCTDGHVQVIKLASQWSKTNIHFSKHIFKFQVPSYAGTRLSSSQLLRKVNIPIHVLATPEWGQMS